MNFKLLTKIFAILITIVLLALLFSQINLGDVIATLKNINPVYLVAGFILYTCSYVLRAWRFHLLLNKEVAIKDLFHIECVHNMLNNLLPLRTGELSYIYLLKSEQNRTTGEALGTLIIARIFDFIIITVFFLLLFFFTGEITPGFTVLVVIGIIFLISMVVLLIGLLIYGNAMVIQLQKLLRFFDFGTIRIGSYITRKLRETINCFNSFKAGESGKHHSVIFLTLGIWSFSYLLFYLIALSMNIDLGLIPILFASSFAVFSTVLPVQGIGGFGTMEAGWALGFISVGVTKEIAISTGFGFHLIVLMYTLFLGIWGYSGIFLSRKTRNI
jgi:glycosyltransferase 2 family protein